MTLQQYTQRQFENAKHARRLYQILGRPTVENFKALLRMNMIENCPVNTGDMTIAETIFGPDITGYSILTHMTCQPNMHIHHIFLCLL